MEFTRNTDILNGIIAYDSSASELHNQEDSQNLIISGHDYNYNKVANFGEKTYQIIMSPIFTSGMPSGMEEHGDDTNEWRGTILFLFDITKKVEGELMRREFTANVSHELKTCLLYTSRCV